MTNTLGSQLTTWRTNKQGHQGLLSKLNINGQLYDIKDPAVEFLATEIESRLGTLENKTIRSQALAKSGDAKFATSVTQGTDGQIAVEYGNIRESALEDSAATGQYVTTVSQGVDGQITVTKGGVDASNVTFNTSGTGLTKTNVQEAIAEGHQSAMALKGVQATDAYTAETIAGAKNYTDYKVNQLAGEDWTANAKKVQDIINELEGTQGDWTTLVDKLTGLQVDNQNVTVKQYVDSAIAGVQSQATGGISDLDAIVTGLSNGTSDATANAESTYTNATTQLVAVKVTEVDGKITAVNVKTNDVAKESDLTTLSNAVVKSVNSIQATNNDVTLTGSDVHVSGTDSTSVATALSNLDTNKANKNAIQSGTVNNWTASYAAEQLTWTSVETNVYVPSGSGSL